MNPQIIDIETNNSNINNEIKKFKNEIAERKKLPKAKRKVTKIN